METHRIARIPRRRTRATEHNNIIVIYDYINKNIFWVYQSHNPSVCYSSPAEKPLLEILNKKNDEKPSVPQSLSKSLGSIFENLRCFIIIPIGTHCTMNFGIGISR